MKTKYEDKSQFPIENMQYKDIPPLFVAIIGTNPYPLLNEIIQKISKQKINSNGVVTIGLKNKKISFYGCNSFLDMIDVSKVVDLVILDVDELENIHFEFLSLLNAHGMCRVTAVIKNNYQEIKRRLYKEIGMKCYNEKNIWKLARMIVDCKARPVEWRCAHPYLIIDKAVDDYVYGYIRGGVIKDKMNVHITGFGDTKILEIQKIGDPCFQECKKLEIKKPVVYIPCIKEEIEIEESSEEESENNFFLFSNKKIKLDDIKNNETENRDKIFELIKENNEELKIQENKPEIEDNNVKNINVFEELRFLKEDLKDFVENDDVESENSEELNNLEGTNDQDSEESDNHQINQEFKNFEEESIIEKTDKLKEKEDIYLLNLKNKLTEEFIKKDAELRKIEGLYFPGEYVKIKIGIKDFKYKPEKLSVMGILNTGEEQIGILQGKVTRNKFYRGMIRNEKIIISMGWKRFVVTPYFSMKDSTKNRMIKCVPLAMTCNIQFQGPNVQPGTPICLIKDPFTTNFRISAYGRITELSDDLLKKVKLVGYPEKIYQNTAIIENMFNSEKEVIKYEGGALKSVSGIRGEIKKPIGKNGKFRASFEAKILKSDIIFLPIYVPVKVIEDYFEFKSLNEIQDLTEEFRKKQRMKNKIENKNQKYNSETEDENFILNEKKKEIEYENEFQIPKYLEKQLPLNQRKVTVKKINIPTPPDDDFEDFKNEIENLKKIKQKNDMKNNELLEMQIKKKELEKNRIKMAGILKNIKNNKK